MNYSTYRISLDIHDIASQTTISVKQGETKRRIVATLMEDGRPYHIADGCNAIFSARKADENIVYNSCRIEGNCIVYEFTDQTTASVGVMNCEFELRDSDRELLLSPRFMIVVEESVNTDAELSDSALEMTEFERLLSQTVKVTDVVNNVETKDASKVLSAEQGALLSEALANTNSEAVNAAERAKKVDEVLTAFLGNDYQKILGDILVLKTRLDALANSDDTTLDTLSEIVSYIKENRGLVESVTTAKVGVDSIADDLNTNDAGKVLSAAQGVVLKGMSDKTNEAIGGKVDKAFYQDVIGAGTQFVRYTLKSDDAVMKVSSYANVQSLSVGGMFWPFPSAIVSGSFTLPNDLEQYESLDGYSIFDLWKRGAVVELEVSDEPIDRIEVTGKYAVCYGSEWERIARYDFSGRTIVSGEKLLDVSFGKEVTGIIILVDAGAKASARGNCTITLTDAIGQTVSLGSCGLFYISVERRICKLERNGIWWGIWPGTTGHDTEVLGGIGPAVRMEAVATTGPTLGDNTFVEVWALSEVVV